MIATFCVRVKSVQLSGLVTRVGQLGTMQLINPFSPHLCGGVNASFAKTIMICVVWKDRLDYSNDIILVCVSFGHKGFVIWHV